MSCSQQYGMLISEFVDGELSGEDEARLRAHLETCHPCRALLRDFEEQREVFIAALEAGARAVVTQAIPRAAVKPNGRKRRKAVPRVPLPILRRPVAPRLARPRFSVVFLAAALALVVLSLALVSWSGLALRAIMPGTGGGDDYAVQPIKPPADLSWAEAVAAQSVNRFTVGQVVRYRFGVKQPKAVTFVWNAKLESSLVARQGHWEVTGWARHVATSGWFIIGLVDSPMPIRYADLPPGQYALCLRISPQGVVSSLKIDVCGVHQGVLSPRAVYCLDNRPRSEWRIPYADWDIPETLDFAARQPHRMLTANSSRIEGEFIGFAVAALLPSDPGDEPARRAQIDWDCRPIHALLQFRRKTLHDGQ